MPKQIFKLSAHDARPVLVEWKGIWKNVRVSLDGKLLGTIPDSKALKAGQSYVLDDGSTLGVKLKGGMQPGLELSRNGVALPGTKGDPNAQLKLARGIVWFIGGLTLILGLVAELGKVQLLLEIGMGWMAAAVGAVFLVLGWFVGKRSMIALTIAIALLILDMVLTLMASADGGRVPMAAVGVRIFFLIALFQGFKAIKDLKAADKLKNQTDAF